MEERYSRQMLFPGIGKAGQEKLLNSRILLVGCGALGASHAEMLARAGVGRIRIVDRDFVEHSNLQRQTLYKESDADDRLPKAVAAKNRITEINSGIDVEAIIVDVTHSNIESLIADCDGILDGTDNFQVRYLLNDACVKHYKTWIYGAAVSSYGTTMTVIPGKTPCLRCVFEELPDAGSSPTCDTAGVIMPVIATISAIQVTEALKILTGNTDALHRSLMQFDVWQNDFRKISLAAPDPDCKTCGQRIFEFLDTESPEFGAVLCGRDAVQISPVQQADLDLDLLSEKLSQIGPVKKNQYLVRFLTGNYELTVFQDGRAVIRGTDDVSTARSLYAKFIGN